MSKRSKTWLFVGLGVLLMGAVIALVLVWNRGEGAWTANPRPFEDLPGEKVEIPGQESALPAPETLSPLETETPEPGEILTGDDLPTMDMTEAPTEPGDKPTEAPRQTDPPQTGQPTEAPEPTDPPQTERPTLELPYEIPGTDLVVGRLDSYEGTFLEQGTDTSTDNVAMILLSNTGTEALEYAIITITMADGTVLEFEPTCLVPGGKMVVQERSCKAFPGGEMVRCVGETAMLSELPMSQNQVKVTENENSTLTITNITDKTIPGVRVFYKLYMAEEDGYVGGITYMAKVTDLAPGASTTVRPSHYLYGSCKVVMVRSYETAD